MNVHELRKSIDKLIFVVENLQVNEMVSIDEPRALALVKTKLQEAKMWAGKVLEAQNKPLPKEFRDHCEERDVPK